MEENKYWTDEQILEYVNKLNEYNNKPQMNVDMHNHTTGSDGADSPLMLMLRAHRMGLDTISITDHNEVKGYKQLEDQIDKILTNLEEIDSRDDIPLGEKEKMRKGAKRLLNVLEDMNIVTGSEIVTTFKGCPFVEILAYGVNLDILEQKLKEMKDGLAVSSEVIAKGLKENIKKNNIKIDEFILDNLSDYKKLFFHEVMRHPENKRFYESIEGETEEEKTENFAKNYLENPESDFYVDLNNPKTRKKEMQEMIKRHGDLTFDIDIIKYAGIATGQFYTELLKYPENKKLIDPRIDSLKKFNYLGLYNEKSPFFVDVSSTKPTLENVIKAIRESGGKALVAHWGRYILSNEDVFNWKTEEGRKNLEELIDMCDGAECAYPDNSLELQKTIYEMCKEKGKIISIGGDNHGKSGKEGMQYQLGSQTGREVEELEWIKQSTIDGKEFLKQLEEKRQYKKRLKQLIELKEQRDKQINNEDIRKKDESVLGE